MKNTGSLWFQVEQEIARLLLDGLELEQITPERASEIAKFVVATIPQELTDQQMMEIIPALDDEFIELSSVVHKHLKKTDDEIRQKQLNDIRAQLQQYLTKKQWLK